MKNENYPFYEVGQVNNLKELVNYTVEKYCDKPAFVFERRNETISVSYRQFKSDVDALGTEFDFIDIKTQKIAVIGENSYEWILTYFAAVNSGNVIVPLDKELPVTEIKNLINESGAEVLVYSDNYADIADYLKENSADIKQYIDMKDFPEMIHHGEIIIRSGEKRIVDYVTDDYALAALLYTSGTTGNAKGVMLTHKNLANNAVSACQSIYLPHSSLLILPLHHSFSFTGGILVMMLSGTIVAINQSLRTLKMDFQQYKPRNVLMVPLFVETFYKQILAEAKGRTDKRTIKKIAIAVFGGNLATIVCGGAPLDKKYIEQFRDIGIAVLEGYGITECSPVVSVNRNWHYRDGSIGRILPSCEVKISDLNENGHGEICVKGDIVMIGYYNNEQATRAAFDGDWFKTGDIGHIDKDGFLFISGRKKNMIILNNGKNVYPEELEFALLNHIPYIKEVVIYAEYNTIIAEVFIDSENETDCVSRLDNDIIGFNQTQAPYKNIGKTIIRETEFPKTTTKKIKRQYK